MKFSAALDRKLEDIKRPPNPPVGHYIFQINKHPEIDEFTSRNTGASFERITFNAVIVSASDDVDEDDLRAFGNVSGFPLRKTFLFPEDDADQSSFEQNMFNLRRFLSHCNVDEDLSLSEALAASVNTQFLGELKHRPDPNDTEVVYAEIGKTAQV